MSKRLISQNVYDELINELPEIIIKMLPDEPINLLKYAQRVEEIHFAPNLKDDVKSLMKQYLLSDKEYLRTFYYAMAITFYHKEPVANPQISIVAAQTGSGKSNLTAKLLRANDNYIFVDSDKYKHFRYDAQEIAKKYTVLYPFLTGPDGYDCADNIYNYAVNNKYNIIKETAPSANKGLLGINEEELVIKGYKVNVHILAVGELNSILSLHERYEKQILSGLRTAKLTPLSRHDESYNALLKNVEDLVNNNNISNICVYKRGIKEENFDPNLVFPSPNINDPIQAIVEARKEENNKTKKEFADRYNLIFEQMNNRNAPQEQIEQLKSVKIRYESSIKEE